MRPLRCLLLLAVSAACGRGGSAVLTEPPADIDVAPLTLDFGNVALLARVTLPVLVQNLGQGSGQFTVHAPTGYGAALFDVGPQGTFSLPGGQSQIISVTYSPLTTTSADVAALVIDGPIVPAKIALQGKGVTVGLLVAPNSLDFGFVVPCQPLTKPVHLKNVGGVTLDIVSAFISEEDDAGDPASPWLPRRRVSSQRETGSICL